MHETGSLSFHSSERRCDRCGKVALCEREADNFRPERQKLSRWGALRLCEIYRWMRVHHFILYGVNKDTSQQLTLSSRMSSDIARPVPGPCWMPQQEWPAAKKTPSRSFAKMGLPVLRE